MARVLFLGYEQTEERTAPDWVRRMRYHLRRAGVLRRKRGRLQQTSPADHPTGRGSSRAYHPVELMNGSNQT
jgi:hypothetical protein